MRLSAVCSYGRTTSEWSRIGRKIQILGTGCPKSKKLTENAEAAAEAAGVEYTIEKVTDINGIMAFGVMMTPALVVDGEVKTVGKVPTVAEIQGLLA
jgi:small redox-active disulfide protein 2